MHLLGIPHSIVSFNRYGAGLGNRVRAVLGARSLADHEGRSLAYVWPTGSQFGPRFTDLWQFQAPVLPRAASRAIAPIWPYRDHTLDWLTDQTREDLVWQIRTAHALALPVSATPWEDQLRALPPVPAVASRVEAFFNRHLSGSRYVGVMIRAHALSHAKTLESSPVEWFVERMQQLREVDQGLGFFVSSDTPEVAARVCSEIPGAVTQEGKGPYNSTDGVQAAVADLYLLASSAYILGPHWSSFVELAEILSGGQLTMETPMGSSGTGHLHPRLAEDPLRPWVR